MSVVEKTFTVKPGPDGGFERILFDGREICVVKYHFKYWTELKGVPREVKLGVPKILSNGLEVSGAVPDVGRARITYITGKDMCVYFSFVPDTDMLIGFYFLGLEFPGDAFSSRLMPGVYCGYTGAGGTFKFASSYFKEVALSQVAAAVDQERDGRGVTMTQHQYFAMSFPPAFKDGSAEVRSGREVVGELTVNHFFEDIWDPVHKIRESEQTPRVDEVSSRFPYSRYLENWEKYIMEPDLWVELAPDTGLFHVGFYNVLSDPKRGGPFGYTFNGKRIRYREVNELLFGAGTDYGVRLGYFQDNMRQLEIAWGNGCNVMVAYALYHYGGDWFRTKADAIVKAVLEFRGNGFQLADGHLAGAWINAYEADSGRFQDHYGGEQVFLPDQGIVNYFLARIYLESFNRNPLISERIRMNCEEFLLRMEKMHGTFPNAFASDGSAGYSREGYLYDFPNAPGIAQTALSFVVLYRLTGKEKYMEHADRIISEYLLPLIDANKFGFLEYDHRGYCSAGACSILIALAEYIEAGQGGMLEEVKSMQEKTFWHLLSFRHEHDYFVREHSHNTDGWHAVPETRHQFLHGFTPGSCQGEYMLHTRYEYGYSLLRTMETSRSIRGIKSILKNHLNSGTWLQFVNPELKKGFGGITEHVGLRTYIQDTTHLVHSTPLAMIMADRAGLQR